MRGLERLGNLLRDGQGLVERHSGLPRRSASSAKAGDALRQVVALDEFHHERGDATAFFEAVDRGDVGMVQRGERLGFPREARQAVRVMRERRGQHLDGDVAVELCVARAPHLAHPAFAERRGDMVNAEAGAGSQGHVCVV